MRLPIVVTLCVALLAAGAAQAQQTGTMKVGSYAKDFDAKEWINSEPLSLSELRGYVVVVYFWVSYHEGGRYWLELINFVENNQNLGRQGGVYTIGLTSATRKQVEKMLEEEKAFFPVGCESKTAEEWGVRGFPWVVVIDPNGKIAWDGWPGERAEQGGGNFIKTLLEVSAKTPPTRTHPKEAAIANVELDGARKALRDADYREAMRLARRAVDRTVRGDPLRTKCQDMVDLIEALARDRLAAADTKLIEKSWDEAISLLNEVVQRYRMTDASLTARTRLEALAKKNPDVKAILDSQNKEQDARNKLAAAIERLRDRKFGPSYKLLKELVEDYAETEAVKDAQTLLARMEGNEELMKDVRDFLASRECESWLSQARSFISAHQFDRAKLILRRIIDKFPDTRYADDAASELANLP